MCSEDTLFSDLVDLDPVAKNLPETKMMRNAAEAGNWGDPYGDEASGWDFLGAGPGAQITSGGETLVGLDPNDPGDRDVGRTIGTAAALYFGAGALGAEGTTAATGTTAGTEAAATYGTAGEFAAGTGAAETASSAAVAAETGTTAPAGTAGTTTGTAATGTTTADVLKTAKTVATVLQPALVLAQAASNAKMARQLKQQSELTAPAPVTLPTRGNENTIIAQQAALRQQLSRRGRASTILTSPGGEKFGAA
jgi:hypothetical protein